MPTEVEVTSTEITNAIKPQVTAIVNSVKMVLERTAPELASDLLDRGIVMAGGTSQLPTVANILGNILSRPVFVFDPLAGLDLVPSKYDIHGLDANSPGLTVALGLAAHVLEHHLVGMSATRGGFELEASYSMLLPNAETAHKVITKVGALHGMKRVKIKRS
jgi:cell division ATPase FtsA